MKFVILFVALFLLYKLFTNDQKKKAVKEEREQENLAATGEMVKDPVCGAYVSSDSDIRVRQGDEVHLFCSYQCRDKFIKGLNEQGPAEITEAEAEKEADKSS